MKAVMAYRMSKRNGQEERRHEDGDRRRYDRERPDTMRWDWPDRQEDDMRRDEHQSTEEEPNRDYGGAENRYRGRDGRWKSGRRRGEYDGGIYSTYPTERHMDGYEEETEKESVEPVRPKNVIPRPYMPNVPPVAPESRMIGFGNRETETPRSHYAGGRQEAEVGGTMWMEPKINHFPEEDKMDKQDMEKWVKRMRDDKDKPIEPWTVDEMKPLATRFGYPTSGEKFDSFYTVVHMMKSDYCAVAEEFDVNVPAFYAALADAWLKDPDAAIRGREKLESYYKYIVMGKK